ncbi:MAG: phosphatase PAP2 family protein [Bacillaceae bacterium]|nr:phosphatase PAP2 family protein [Bacillaceae bacterium]
MPNTKVQSVKATNKYWSYRLFIVLFSVIFFSWSFYQVVTEKLFFFDDWVRNSATSYTPDIIVQFFYYFTILGSKEGVIPILLLSAIFIIWKKKDYIAASVLIIGVILVNELNKWLKDFTGRERPMVGPGAESLSFPSGHAMVGLFFYGLLAYFLIIYMKDNWNKSFVLIGAGLFIFLLGLSRIFLDYHYASDILAGYAAGYLCLVLFISLYEWLLARKNKNATP